MHGESRLDQATSSMTMSTNNNERHLGDDDAQSHDPNANLNELLHDIETNIGDNEHEKLQHLFEDAEKPLYKGCKFSKLDFVLRLFNLKSKNGWSDKSFTSLLVLLHDILPEDNDLPISTYQAKKLMCPMGLEVERIHACPNDCMLYIKEFKDQHKCVNCGASRYKRKNESDDFDDDVTKNGPPAKMLWYFPIIPRLKRLFSNKKEAKLLRWHSDERIVDGKLRHVADSPQWRNIDHKYPEFGEEIRNIHFGLSSDGINPFGNMSSRHSTWPVLLCIYNLPPWLCMKRKYIMMSLLIQGPKQPGNDIDVYLSPLIDDLKTLWCLGVDVYDAYKEENFKLRAMVFCTISDFPAYGNLSGYNTKGKKACPNCENETNSRWLKYWKKTVYMGHQKFLPRGHIFRDKEDEFDGTTEDKTMRKRFDAFSRVENLKTVLGKRNRGANKGRGVDKEHGVDNGTIWKKRSIFWDLPYWKHLDVRHCLDVMHIEKNVCDSLLGLLLNIPGKTKDGINARKDMVDMGIRKELAPIQRDNRIYLPPACYTTSKEEKTKFCKCLHDIKVPSTYSANIKRLVSMKDCKLFGMKSHDCHVLMTHMIPIAIRGLLPENVRHTITKLCLFFNNIHSKVIDVEALDKWQKDIVETLCELEMYFPPSFFDIMVHLITHIVEEIKSCGPVFLRYMYPFERYMSFLKDYVRNRNRPEGSIVEGYTSEEVIEFCQGYLEGVESIGIPKTRHSGRLDGKGVIGKKAFIPTRDSLETAHLVVLKHMTCLTPYLDEHIDTLRATHPGKDKMWYVNTHNKELSSWLRRKVMETDTDETVNKLGQGPDFKVQSYQGNNNLLIYGKEISEKAKANAAKQTSVPRLGRSGWTGIEEKADFIWPILVEKYPLLDKMKNERSRLYIMGRAKRIKKAKGSETDSYELPLDAITTFGDLVRVEREMIADGSYLKEKDDPLVRVLGSEHGGRSRTVSEVIVDRLSAHVGNDYVIEVVSPNGMYPEPVDEDIPYSELLQIFLNAWLDVTVLHWFAMHFFESSNSRCAFFNPQLINAPLCKRNRAGVGKHIQDIYTLHSEKMFFIAPYLVGKHWSLLIVCPTYKSGYIIDSKRTGKNKNSYLLVSILEEVFRVRFNWHVVKCKQQSSSWECGYMVIKHMQEFVQYIQHDLVNRFWNEEGNFPHSEIEDLVLRLMPEFINKVFEDPTR
ncbi:hypothetical protein SSX86_031464 [Deinandra increscens subsp. villosa]|uniref:Ubiquitin-like protease family profile domain-containing protein n=1 Tax=Deinandra increscens subsp. villosa TaxID=3103831 RepID=A0AAP0C9U4_9ASTR